MRVVAVWRHTHLPTTRGLSGIIAHVRRQMQQLHRPYISHYQIQRGDCWGCKPLFSLFAKNYPFWAILGLKPTSMDRIVKNESQKKLHYPLDPSMRDVMLLHRSKNYQIISLITDVNWASTVKTVKSTPHRKCCKWMWMWIGCLTSQLTIFQSYMWRHIDVQADWRRSWYRAYMLPQPFLNEPSRLLWGKLAYSCSKLFFSECKFSE